MTRRRVFVIGVCSLILVAIVVSVAISAFKRKLDDSRSPVAAGNAFSSSIKVLCGGTPYPEACNESLTRAANGTVLDPAAVFLLAVRVSITELDNASAVIEGLALNSSPDNYTAAVLAECGDLTGFAVEHLNDTLLATNLTSAETVEDLKAWLSASITDQVTCVDDMEGASAAVKAAVIEEALTNSTIFASKVLANYNEIPGLFGQFKHRRLMSSSSNFPSWISLADRILLQSKKDVGVAEEIVLAKDGSGNYSTIAAALKAVPKKSKKRTVIYVKGRYKENVNVDSNLWNMMKVGDGKAATIITGSLNNVDGTPTFQTATLVVLGKGFIAKAIGVKEHSFAIRAVEFIFETSHLSGISK